MSAFSQSACSASDTFEVTREVLLREGSEPHRIIRVDDGYIIVGSGRQGGVAIKTDLQGTKVWDFFMPREKGVDEPSRSPAFTGVFVLKDGNTLLCGGHAKAGEGTKWGPFVGLLIRLDKKGRLLDKRELFPRNDRQSRLNRIQNCTSLGDGVLVLGNEEGNVNPEMNGHWLMGLDALGEFQWEKVLPAQEVITKSYAYGRPLPLVDGGVVIPLQSLTHKNASTRIIKINRSGEIIAQRLYEQTFYSIFTLQPERTVQLLAVRDNDSPTTLMVTLDENLQELSKTQIKMNVASAIYRLADGSYVRFGTHRKLGGELVPAIQRVGSDLMEFRESLLKPESVVSGVRDAVPNSVPGEFATVRQILRGFDGKSSLEEGAGIGLTMVRIK